MEPIEELLRSSGQYDPKVPVPPDADGQTRWLPSSDRTRCPAGIDLLRVTAGGTQTGTAPGRSEDVRSLRADEPVLRHRSRIPPVPQQPRAPAAPEPPG